MSYRYIQHSTQEIKSEVSEEMEIVTLDLSR